MVASMRLEGWAPLMGSELPKAECQPIQPVAVEQGAIRIAWDTVQKLGMAHRDALAVEVLDGLPVVCLAPDRGAGVTEGESTRVPVPEAVLTQWAATGSATAMLVMCDGRAQICPLTVRMHSPDVLGPRFVDERMDGAIVRHVTPGPDSDGWTPEALAKLEGLLCAEAFRVDPVQALVMEDDWAGWMTRRMLNRPSPGDDALGRSMIETICAGQQEDGSWGIATATAYAILRLLALGVAAWDKRLQRASQWLLALPEVPGRPGMWMLNDGYLDEWTRERRPDEEGDSAPWGDGSFYSWDYPDDEQDQFRGQLMQRVIPTCARHHPPACEPRMTHTSALIAEALLRCGLADAPRVRRYLNTVFEVGGAWGYWCGCQALGLYGPGFDAVDRAPDLDAIAPGEDEEGDLAAMRWTGDTAECAGLANVPDVPDRGTHLEAFNWRAIPGQRDAFALIGAAWQNGDCWAKTNRALAACSSHPGSRTERMAVYQASRYQTSLGEWNQGFPAGLLAFLSPFGNPMAKSLVVKTVPWLRKHQLDDGLWHHEDLPRNDWGRPARAPEPRLAAYHIVAALHAAGVLACLRPVG